MPLVDCSRWPRPLAKPWCGFEDRDWTVIGVDELAGVCLREKAVEVRETDQIEYTYQTIQTQEAIDAILDSNKASQARDNAELRKDALADFTVTSRIPVALHRKWTDEMGPMCNDNSTDWKRRLNDLDYKFLRTDPSRRL